MTNSSDPSTGRRPGRMTAVRRYLRERPLRKLDIALIVIATLVVLRLLGYAFFPGVDAFATLPISEDHTRHSCFSAYFLAARLAIAGQAIYTPGLYTAELGAELGVPVHAVNVDAFVYPPLFLPTIGPLASLDFALGRELWMSLCIFALVACMIAVVRMVGTVTGVILARWIPAILLTLSVQSQLQFGNAHLLVMATGLWGMVLIEQGREKSGTALLAWSIGAKLFPGLLVVYLAGRGKWRAIGLTALWGGLLTGLTIAIYGWAPIGEFFTVLVPRLSSGEAFGWLFVKAEAAAINTSPFGIPIKLGFLGLLDSPATWARGVGLVYLLGILYLAWFAGRRQPAGTGAAARLGRVQMAALLLVLGALQTPFYDAFRGDAALFLGVWLLTPAIKKRWIAALLGFELLFLPLVPLAGPLYARIAMGTAGQIVVVVVALLLYNRAMRARGTAVKETGPLPDVA